MGLLEVVREAELNFREQKGIIKKATKIVRNMLKANLNTETIADLAEVSTEFVLEIKTEMKEKKEL